MPRIPRGQSGGHVYHVLNRGNGGAAVFHKDGDYRAFLNLLADAKARYPVKLFGFCLHAQPFPSGAPTHDPGRPQLVHAIRKRDTIRKRDRLLCLVLSPRRGVSSVMPRIPRGQSAGHVYHVLNRGNAGAVVFYKDTDYRAFLDLLADAKARYPVKVLGFCLMPNHFHLVLQPATPNALSPFIHWWLTSHVRRYHRHYHSHGHVWQGRFKSFPIQQDGHLLTVLRYGLRNPIRAGLVTHTQEWQWSSLRHPALINPWPVDMPVNWNQWIEAPLFDHELAVLRTCVRRQAPFGAPGWVEQLATALGLESTLRPRGRPRIPERK